MVALQVVAGLAAHRRCLADLKIRFDNQVEFENCQTFSARVPVIVPIQLPGTA